MIKRNLLVMGLAVLLSACGFQLRGTGTSELALKEIDLSARNAYGETVVMMRQVLQSSGVKVTAGAPYKLVFTNEQTSQRSLSYSGAGRTAENELTTTAVYRGLPGWQTRGIATAALDVKWPFVGEFLGGTQVFTPRVSFDAFMAWMRPRSRFSTKGAFLLERDMPPPSYFACRERTISRCVNLLRRVRSPIALFPHGVFGGIPVGALPSPPP